MLKNLDAKFPPENVGHNVCISIPDAKIYEDHGDPRTVPVLVLNVECVFYKLGT